MLRDITASLGDAPTESMEQIMKDWQQRRRSTSTYETGSSSTGNEGNVTLPLSQGEWDEPLGLPLCVVCHRVRVFMHSRISSQRLGTRLIESVNRQTGLTLSK